MFIGELLVITQNWKLPRCPTSRTDIYILDYSYDGILYRIEINEFLPHALMMSFTDIMMNETSHI